MTESPYKKCAREIVSGWKEGFGAYGNKAVTKYEWENLQAQIASVLEEVSVVRVPKDYYYSFHDQIHFMFNLRALNPDKTFVEVE